MKNLFINIVQFVLFWAVGAFTLAVGVWTLGHQSSAAFELVFILFLFGSFCIAYPIYYASTCFPRRK